MKLRLLALLVCLGYAMPLLSQDCNDDEGNPLPEVTITATFVNTTDCVNDGMVEVQASVSSGSLEYSLDGGPWVAESAFDSLAAGNHSVSARIASYDCSTKSVSGTIEPRKSPIVTDTNVVNLTDWCIIDGSIEIIAEEGEGPLKYSIDSGSTWQSEPLFDSLPGDLYPVAVANFDETCITHYKTVDIPILLKPNLLDYKTIDPSDCDASDGSIILFFEDIDPDPYGYSINDEQHDSIYNPFPPPITKYVNGDLSSYNIMSGPMGPNKFWSDEGIGASPSVSGGGLRTATFGGLRQGVYELTYRRENNFCITTGDTLRLSDPPRPSISLDVDPLIYCEKITGDIIIKSTGGIPPLEYTIDGEEWNATTEHLNLTHGTYTPTVRNSDGTCVTGGTPIVFPDHPLGPKIDDVEFTHPTDCKAKDGYIKVLAIEGSSAPEYSIDGSHWQSSPEFDSLFQGNYSVMVRNSLRGTCTISQEVMLRDPSSPSKPTVGSANTAGDCGLSGTLTVLSSGGIAPLQYSIDGGITYQGNPEFTNLGNGNYSLFVKNSTGTCIVEGDEAELSGTSFPVISKVESVQPTDCGLKDGKLIVHMQGNSDFEYSFDGGTSFRPSNTLSGLQQSDGLHHVIVRNAGGGGCGQVDEGMHQVIDHIAPYVVGDYIFSKDSDPCGANNGFIDIPVSGGDPAFADDFYDYRLNGGPWQRSSRFEDLAPGDYVPEFRNRNTTCLVTEETITIEGSPGPTLIDVIENPASSCTATDGSIEIKLDNPSSDIQYTKDGGETWQNSSIFGGLKNQEVIQIGFRSESQMCEMMLGRAWIDAPTAPEQTSEPQINAIDCDNQSGSIRLSYASNSDRVVFSMNDGAWRTNSFFPNLPVGDYNFRVRNADGTCAVSAGSFTLNNTPVSVDAIISNHPDDCGASDGNIKINSSGGGVQEYSIDGGTTFQSSNYFDELPQGVYPIVVRNTDESCINDYSTVTLKDPEGPKIFFVQGIDPRPCKSDGIVHIGALPGSGKGSYEYSIDGVNWQPGKNFNHLDGGTYTTHIRNSDETCPNSGESVTLNSAPITPEIDEIIATDPTICTSPGNGQIEVKVIGGTPPYEYSSDGGITWQSSSILSRLTGGTYAIKVRNKNTSPNCEVSYGNVTLNNPAEPAIYEVTHTAAAPCQSNGSITIHPVAGSGTGSFQYKITGHQWQDSKVFPSLAGGTYIPSIRNSDETCATNGTAVEISNGNPIAPIINGVTPIEPTCQTSADGKITINASSGNPPYEYSKDNGVTWQSEHIFNNLNSGTYQIAVRNASQTCVITYGSVTIANPAALALSVTPTCAYQKGTITLNVSGGNGTYEYRIHATAVNWVTDPVFADLSPGTYQPEVRIKGSTCTKSYGDYVVEVPNRVEVGNVSKIAPTNCAKNGSITITAKAGTGSGNYTYSLDGLHWENSPVFSNLTGGTYLPRIQDMTEGCVAGGAEIVFTANVPVDISGMIIYPTDPNCDNENGAITIDKIRTFKSNPDANALKRFGSEEYEYSKDNGNTYQSSNTFPSLGAGTYQIWVRNNDGTCPAYLGAATLTRPIPPSIAVTITQPIDCSTTTGTIKINGTGGVTPYKYHLGPIGNWNAKETNSNLAPGTYFPAIANADGTCIVEYSPVVINNIDKKPSATIVPTRPTDCGLTDGTLTVNASGGNDNGYLYRFNNGSYTTNNQLTGLTGGTNHTIKIYNADYSCEVEYTAYVPETTTPIVTNVTSGSPSIGCREDGWISITATGGIGTYNFKLTGTITREWQTSGYFSSLPAGNYTVQVRNSNGSCLTTHPVLTPLPAPAAPELIIVSTSHPTGCGNPNDGTIVLSGGCGKGPYRFSINNGSTWQTSGNYSGLGSGTYLVKIKNADDTGISAAKSITLVAPTIPIVTDTIVQQPTDCAVADGSIKVLASTGSGGLLYSKDGGSTWQGNSTFSNLSGGSFDIAVKNANGTCTVIQYGTVIIKDHQAPSIDNVDSSNPSDCNAEDGTVTITVSGGDELNNYQYKIDGYPWQTTNVIENVVPGTYTVSVKNGNGTCLQTATQTITIADPIAPSISVVGEDPDGCGLDNGIIRITGTNGNSGAYQFSIDDGDTWQDNNGLFTDLPNGNYPTKIRNMDQTCEVAGPTAQLSSDLLPVIQRVTPAAPTDCGEMNGSIAIVATGGNQGTLQYSIDDGVSWETSGTNVFGNLPVGTYQVKVRNENESCEVAHTESVEILPHIAPIITNIVPTQPTDCWVDDGTISISATGGDDEGEYEYSLDSLNWQPSNEFLNLSPTKTAVFVRNINTTCAVVSSSTDSVEIAYPITPELATPDYDNPMGCGVDDGYIHLTGTAGNGTGYQYSIDGGQSWETDGNFDDLPNGIYSIMIGNGDETCQYLTNNIALSSDTLPVFESVVVSQPQECSELGMITVNYTEGNRNALEHSLDDGLTWYPSSDFSAYQNLPTGTYHLKLRNNNGSCEVPWEDNPILIQEKGQPIIEEVLRVQPTSCDSDNGQIIIVSSGGTVPGQLNYSIDDGATWQPDSIFMGLTPNTYKIAIQNPDGSCLESYAIDVVIHPAIPPVINRIAVENPTGCDQTDNGSISIIASPTPGTYGYSIDGGQTWQNSALFSGLMNGTYTIQIRNADSTCIVGDSIKVLTSPNFATVDSVKTTQATDCEKGDATLSIYASSEDGITNFLYSIDQQQTWQNDPVFTNLTSGDYEVAVSNGDGTCPFDYETTVNIPALSFPDIVEVTPTPTTDCHLDDGSLIITASGTPFAGYQYSIDGGQSWSPNNHFDNLADKKYMVGVRYADETCSTMMPDSVEIKTPPPPLNSSLTSVAPDDCQTNGTITISNTIEGLTPYQYSIDGGQQWQYNNIFSDLEKGDYEVYVSNADTTCRTLIEQLSFDSDLQPILDSAVFVHPTLETTGTITIYTTGGNDDLEFRIHPDSLWQSSNVFGDLEGGHFTPAVRNAGSETCYTEGETKYLIPGRMPLMVDFEVIPPTDCNQNDARVIVRPTGGISPYYVSLHKPNTPFVWRLANDVPIIIPDVNPGFYHVAIRSFDTIQTVVANDAVLIEEVKQPVLAGETITHPSCYADDGQIVMEAEPSLKVIEYSIDDGQSWHLSPQFDNLPEGEFILKVRNQNSTCSSIGKPIQLDRPDQATITNAIVSQPTDCGLFDGRIEIEVTGADRPLEYAISVIQGEIQWQTSPIFDNLRPFSYLPRIRNADGSCAIEEGDITRITPQTKPTIQLANPIAVSDCNAMDGEIQVLATSQSGTLNYSLDGGATWGDETSLKNLAGGEYTLMVGNEGGACPVTYSEPITVESPIQPELDQIRAYTECGTSLGTIEVSGKGGNGSYQYTLNDSENWSANGFLAAAAGSTNRVFIANEDLTCKTQVTTIVVPNPTNVSFLPSDVDLDHPQSCLMADGKISITGMGRSSNQATSPLYEFKLTQGTNIVREWKDSFDFSNLATGVYELSARTKTGESCQTKPFAVRLTSPKMPNLSAVPVDISDCGLTDGMIRVSSTDSNVEFTLNDAHPKPNNEVYNDLVAGTYLVTVRNTLTGCTQSETHILTAPTPPVYQDHIVQQPTDCSPIADGQISIFAQAGNATIAYSLNGTDWQDSPVFDNLGAGDYELFLANEDGRCLVETGVSLTFNSQIGPNLTDMDVETKDISCQDAGSITFLTEQPDRYAFTIDAGQTWVAGQAAFEDLVAAEYHVGVRNLDGSCELELGTFPINTVSMPTMTVSQSSPADAGQENGQIEIRILGGKTPFKVSWSGPTSGGLIQDTRGYFVTGGFVAGEYLIQLEDGNGCITEEEISVEGSEPLSIECIQSTDTEGCGFKNIDIKVGGAMSSYELTYNEGVFIKVCQK